MFPNNRVPYRAPKIPEDWWTDINSLQSGVAERTGYPTQKPLALYERVIRASSNESDIVLDPFAGCATTLVAAERLGRQWVGMDIWDKAHEIVVERLHNEVGLFGDVQFTAELPERTDTGETAAPHLQVKLAVQEPEGRHMSRQEMYQVLLSRQGPKCQGCERVFDDPRYLELDHNTPRSDGGSITSRTGCCYAARVTGSRAINTRCPGCVGRTRNTDTWQRETREKQVTENGEGAIMTSPNTNNVTVQITEFKYGDQGTTVTFECEDVSSAFHEFVDVYLQGVSQAEGYSQLALKAHETLADQLSRVSRALRYAAQDLS